MCSINANCEVYNHDSTNCDEASAINLVGASPNSLTSKFVYIDQNIYKNNKGKLCKILCKPNLMHHMSLADGEWVWASWTTCSTTCGPGTRSRSAQSCHGPFYGGMQCPGSGTETESCQSMTIFIIFIRTHIIIIMFPLS